MRIRLVAAAILILASSISFASIAFADPLITFTATGVVSYDSNDSGAFGTQTLNGLVGQTLTMSVTFGYTADGANGVETQSTGDATFSVGSQSFVVPYLESSGAKLDLYNEVTFGWNAELAAGSTLGVAAIHGADLNFLGDVDLLVPATYTVGNDTDYSFFGVNYFDPANSIQDTISASLNTIAITVSDLDDVPEPSSLAYLLGGLSAVFLVVRYQRSAA